MAGDLDPGSRVVLLGPDHPDSFANHIADAFADRGISASVVDPAGRYSRPGTFRAYTRTRRLVTQAAKRLPAARAVLVDQPVEQALEAKAPQLVISVNGYFEPAQVERWRRHTPAAVWALWYPDTIVNLGRQSAFVAGYDHLFFKDPYLVDLLASRTSLPVHFLPEACSPSVHRSERPHDTAEQERYRCDVAVAGNMYPYRRLVLHELPADIDLKLYGNPPTGDERLMPSFTGRYVTCREKALAIGEAAIVLNTMVFGEVRSVNARLFEATACGGFVLTHDAPELDRYFVDGEEVVAFTSPSELRELIAHYLAAPDERRRIAAAGQARAHRDHTYDRRLDELIGVCGLAERLQLTSADR